MNTPDTPLISTEALAAQMTKPDLRIIDASWWLDGRNARADFERERLPGAVFFDLDAMSDREIPYPHIDRKSTRLNSSHVKISYAVFCLKKKNEHTAHASVVH